MKTILLPTDFSNYSKASLNLALIFAKSLKAKIIVCHVIQAPISIGEVPYPLLQKELNELKKASQSELNAYSNSFRNTPEISFETQIIEGETVHELLQLIKEKSVDLVIMGTKGKTNLQEIILGSTTEQLILKSKCPVMAVPENISFHDSLKHVTYATDYHNSDVKDILQLIEFAESLKAQVNILHISGDEIPAEKEVKMMSDFMKKINEKCSYNNLSFQILHGNKVIEELNEYLMKDSTDILVTATHHRHLLERLFGKSNTLNLIKSGKVPIIAFHHSAKN